MAEKTKNITGWLGCRVEPDTEKKFREAAEERRRPTSQLLRVLVEEFVEREDSKRPLLTK